MIAVAIVTAQANAAPSLIAPSSSCPGQARVDVSAKAQVRAMRCLTEFARRRAGLPALESSGALHRSARLKAADVLLCDEFSHFACGREFPHWIRATGYMSSGCWHVGENLAWGEDALGAPRSVFLAWMRSSSHRENILGDFAEIGIGLRAGTLEGRPGTRVWAQHFGTRCSTGLPEGDA